MRKGGEGGSGYEKFVRKGGRGVLDRKSLCAKGGEGGSGYDKLVRKPYLEGFLLFFINRINSSQRRHKLHS